MTHQDPDVPDRIRIVQHNLIDICDLLGATLVMDGNDVTFVARDRTGRYEMTARMGDWIVADPRSGWRIVPDREAGRSQPVGPEVATPAAEVHRARQQVPTT